jgi:hypothetical protein
MKNQTFKVDSLDDLIRSILEINQAVGLVYRLLWRNAQRTGWIIVSLPGVADQQPGSCWYFCPVFAFSSLCVHLPLG